jgi:polyphenol oxidase
VETLQIEDYEFLAFKDKNINMIFSTAKGELNFNINEKQGKNNIIKLKNWFGLEEIGFLHQTHSNAIFIYDEKVHEGDALITNKKNTAIGVFTADCVPVLILDRVNQVIAAVHSGWKGTLNGITLNVVARLIKEYNSKPEELVAYIGPHNQSCCYEIGKDVKELFNSNHLFNNLHVVHQGKLNLEKCIEAQLMRSGVLSENIKSTNVCTFCNEKLQLYSYRKLKDSCGRMFSFIYLT